MFQFFFLTEVFLFLSAGLLLANKYGMRLLFLINIRDFFCSKKTFRIVYGIVGLFCASVLFFFPTEPRPSAIGDLIPLLMILFDLVYVETKYLKSIYETDLSDSANSSIGVLNLVVALVHFIIPSIVLL